MLLRGQRFVGRGDYGTPVAVDLGHTAYHLLSGHRLRLHIASSDYPLYLWHPGTGADPWRATTWAVNEQRLSAGGDRGSCLDLTVFAGEERLAQGGSAS